ncbi:MAG: hypothetical protein H7Z13_09930 [Ferruginibacter sp.]|nr:hypothetical protein [Ferruginibacter sp.]
MDRLDIAVLILIVAGTLMPLFCIIKMQMIKKFLKNAAITPAVVTHAEKRTGLKGAVYYLLAIEYKDNSGRLFNGSAIGAKKNAPGTTVPVMYNVDDPTKYKTDFGKYLPWLLGFSLIFLAGILWFSYWLLNLNYTVRP